MREKVYAEKKNQETPRNKNFDLRSEVNISLQQDLSRHPGVVQLSENTKRQKKYLFLSTWIAILSTGVVLRSDSPEPLQSKLRCAYMCMAYESIVREEFFGLLQSCWNIWLFEVILERLLDSWLLAVTMLCQRHWLEPTYSGAWPPQILIAIMLSKEV